MKIENEIWARFLPLLESLLPHMMYLKRHFGDVRESNSFLRVVVSEQELYIDSLNPNPFLPLIESAFRRHSFTANDYLLHLSSSKLFELILESVESQRSLPSLRALSDITVSIRKKEKV